MDPTLDDIGKALGDVTDGMAPLVAMRKTLVQGGWSPEAAEAMILQQIKDSNAQTLERIRQGMAE